MPIYRSCEDIELISLLKQGDHSAFNEIYDRYGMMIYFKVNLMLRDPDISKDLVQELFISIWSNHAAINVGSNLAGYLYIAARNRVINFIRSGKTKNDFLLSLARYGTEIGNTTLEALDERELMALLKAEIAKLPEKMRRVFELSRLDNLSHREIAKELGISEYTVKTQIHNSLAILKSKLGEFGVGGLVVLVWMEKIN